MVLAGWEETTPVTESAYPIPKVLAAAERAAEEVMAPADGVAVPVQAPWL